MFEEPSSYLDVKQRLKAARVIRSLLRSNSYVIVVDHDLSVLDYLSDFVCCLYGKPNAYGVVTLPFLVWIRTHLRFQDHALKFTKTQETREEIEPCHALPYRCHAVEQLPKTAQDEDLGKRLAHGYPFLEPEVDCCDRQISKKCVESDERLWKLNEAYLIHHNQPGRLMLALQ
ncbi:hypothetical protein ACFE04_001559 [Oxalis oulophora]